VSATAARDGPPPDLRSAETTDKGHGRIEVRRLTATREIVPYLQWPDLAQVCRIERTREIAGKTSREVAYAVTSLAPERAKPDDLLALLREHWLIENRLHWRRDTALAEDACRVRSGNAPQALAALRNVVLRIADNQPGPLRAVRETFAENRADAIAAITQRIL
jgi:predicted transposase YbfD/YdcC